MMSEKNGAGTRIEMSGLSYVAVAMILLGLLGGCEQPLNWQAFDSIEVGRKLPDPLPAGMVREGFGMG